MRIGIVCLSVNLWSKRTKPALDSLKSKHELFTVLIDNGSVDETQREAPKVFSKYIRNNSNVGVSAGWNQGIKECWENSCEYILVINNDILFRSDTLDSLIARIERKDENIVMVTACNVKGDCREDPTNLEKLDIEQYKKSEESESPDYSAFLISKKYWDIIGEFDEAFCPGYWEDNDSHYRIKVTGLKAINCPGALYYHFGSETRTNNPGLITNWQFDKNKKYYILKWGGLPSPHNTEIFKTPFGDKARPIQWTYQDRCKTTCIHNPKCGALMLMITG